MKEVCAVCKTKATKVHPVFKFEMLLRERGFRGRSAHVKCIKGEQDKAASHQSRFGVPMERGPHAV